MHGKKMDFLKKTRIYFITDTFLHEKTSEKLLKMLKIKRYMILTSK